MKVKQLLILALMIICVSGAATAQDTIYVDKINATKAFELQMPVMSDSTNLKGEKFDQKNLLTMEVQLPTKRDFIEVLQATDNKFEPKQADGDYNVQFFSFSISSDRYSKGSINITTPHMLELYVDGKKEGMKSTFETEADKAKSFTKEITLMPYQAQEVIIKYLSTKDSVAGSSSIKIAAYPSKKDSLARLTLTNDGKRQTKFNDGYEGVRVGSLQISPKGDFAIATYRSMGKDGKPSGFTNLINLKTNHTVSLANVGHRWMPKSNLLFYIKQMGDDNQLITVDPNNLSETVIYKNVPKGGFNFSPDETFLLYTEIEKIDGKKDDFKLLKAPDDRIDGYMNRYFIHKYDLATGVKQRLTFGKSTTALNDISADSRYIIYTTSRETITERPFRDNSVFILDLQTMSVDTLYVNEKFVGGAKFSPDAKEIIVTGAPEAFNGIGLNIEQEQIANSYDTQAYIVNVESRKITPISKEFNPSISGVYWNKNDGLIYMTVADKDCESVYSYNPKNSKYTKLQLPEDVISGFSVANDANTATYVGRNISHPSRAYTYDLKSKKSTLLSDPMGEVMSNLQLGEVNDWSFTASDGTVIEGFYHLPPNFDKDKKYPMIVYYYGGTTPSTRTFEHPYSMHNFASLGYVVYTVQPSGAIGYGQKFSARHVNAWGKRTAEDIIEGTKEFVKQHGFVDGTKIGCLGASYGGFMTLYLQTQTDIFAAAISHAGISALSSYWGEGYWGYSYSSGASAHSYPWNNEKLYVEQSPLFNADKIKTPILLTHGTVDTNVPIGESIQMYAALKILGVPVEFLQVKDENHGIAKYERRMRWSQSMYAWFDKWLKEQPQWWDAMYPTMNKE